MRYIVKIPFLAVITLTVIGCTTFHPDPLSPSQIAAAFEARTIDNPGLKEFIEKNIHYEITTWPPESWNFTMFTLAVFYDLDVARAGWGVAKAGVITAGSIPNPSVNFRPQYNDGTAGGLSPWTLGFNLDIPLESARKRGYRIENAAALGEAARIS